MRVLKRLRLAITYVTCFPVARIEFDEEEKQLAGLSKYLPVVGILIGCILFALSQLFHIMHVEPLLTGSLLALTWLCMTGSLHMDGLMDAADGIFSHQSKERMLEIMHDSRVGNFGVLAGVSILILKIASLASMHGHLLAASVFCIPIWSRWGETYAIGKFKYAREFGKGRIWHATTIFPIDLLKATAPAILGTAIGVATTNAPMIVIIPVISTIAGGIISAHRFNKIIDGQTGDTYGAVVEIAETVGLLVTALCSPLFA
jgi:adenosylcobinamide-GDP ribazoletransferase